MVCSRTIVATTKKRLFVVNKPVAEVLILPVRQGKNTKDFLIKFCFQFSKKFCISNAIYLLLSSAFSSIRLI